MAVGVQCNMVVVQYALNALNQSSFQLKSLERESSKPLSSFEKIVVTSPKPFSFNPAGIKICHFPDTVAALTTVELHVLVCFRSHICERIKKK